MASGGRTGSLAGADGTNVQVAGGGTATGIEALIGGSADVCLSLRPMRPEERELLRTRYATTGVEIPVARKAISIYVNQANPISELTVEQVRKVFTGEILSWKELGGGDEMVTVYVRDPASESHALFKSVVLRGAPLTPRSLPAGSNTTVATSVGRSRFAIGFGSVPDVRGLRGV